MSKKTIQPGNALTQSFVVERHQTARALGSGELEVFSTPSMIACMENTAMKLIAESLIEGFSSVGAEINAKHLKASAIGERIVIKATVISVQARSVYFEITAVNDKGNLIGTATHTRVIVDVQRFMAKISG